MLKNLISPLNFALLILPTFTFVTPSLSADQAISLFDGKDLSAWKKPIGEWQTASAVSLDPANNKKFTIQTGEGVLVNGPKGRTQNLLTQAEYGDVEAHIGACCQTISEFGRNVSGSYPCGEDGINRGLFGRDISPIGEQGD